MSIPPRRIAIEQHVKIPQREVVDTKEPFRVRLAHRFILIPVMPDTRIGHQLRSTRNVMLGAAQLGHPDDIDRYLAILGPLQPSGLDRGDPAKTDPSRRRCEQDRSHFSRVGLELSAKRLEA